MSVGDLLACCLRVTQWHCGKHNKTPTQASVLKSTEAALERSCPLCFADESSWCLMTTSGQNAPSCLVSPSFRPLVWFPARPGNETGLDNIYILPCAAVLSLVELNPQWEELTGVLCSLAFPPQTARHSRYLTFKAASLTPSSPSLSPRQTEKDLQHPWRVTHTVTTWLWQVNAASAHSQTDASSLCCTHTHTHTHTHTLRMSGSLHQHMSARGHHEGYNNIMRAVTHRYISRP